ncbi:MAG: hypothetical protein SVU69_03505 [Pseudomonadota bacterium]|nr:hypothetical protein [Pseudomonadota bacterium]
MSLGHWMCTAAQVGLICLCLAAEAWAAPVSRFVNLTGDVGPGFGDTRNRYAWSLAKLGDDLFVGTANVDQLAARLLPPYGGGAPSGILQIFGFVRGTGGEIWRLDAATGRWSKVYKSRSGSLGLRKMIVHNGKIFAGSANYQSGAELIVSENGFDWTVLSGGPLEDAANTSIRAMSVYNGTLYVGTENSNGAELWTYTEGGGDPWSFRNRFPDGSVSELTEFGGELYVGTWDFGGTYALYAGDGLNFTDVTPTQSLPAGNVGVMRLQPFSGQLYLTTVNYINGFSLLRSANPDVATDWELITSDGLGDPRNAYGWASAVVGGTMYIGTFQLGGDPLGGSTAGLAKLYASEDGTDWRIVVDNGFGLPSAYGIRTLLADGERLYVGTASNILLPNPPLARRPKALTLEAVQDFRYNNPDLFTRIMRIGLLPAGRTLGCEVWVSDSAAP